MANINIAHTELLPQIGHHTIGNLHEKNPHEARETV